MLAVPAPSHRQASSSQSSLASNSGTPLWPTAPEMVMEQRYAQRVKVERKDVHMKLRPKDTEYDEPPIDDWVRCTQPEGSSYFLNSSKRILTDADISKRHTLKKINIAAGFLVKLAGDMFTVDDEIQLVIGIGLGQDEGTACVLYYFVDHKRRLLFWVHDYDLAMVSSNVKGVTRMSHMKYAIETQYWTHLELYPNLRKLKAEHQAELKGILIHASTETLTSNTSMAPFDLDELGRMLDLVDKTEGSIGQEQVHAVYVVARLMRMFSNSRFVNFYGQPEARLNADQSVYSKLRGQDEATSPLITISDIFLFGGPSAHASELRRVWVDWTVNFPRWKGFISKLSNEWTGFTIYSTVMLAVDVSFLAIPTLNPDVMTTMPEAANIMTYLSVIFVVGSLVVSLQLSNTIRGQESSSAKESAAMMMKSTRSTMGTDALAIMYSLPFALLIWGMIFFILALGLVVFGVGDHITVRTVLPGAIIVGLLTAWPSVGNRGKYIVVRNWWIQSFKWLQGPRAPTANAV
ncbi:hypothetical protein PAXINDRAFT_166942 [Paxillus involutus ATCC 200175]|nr:hypothetical protein PAXINDRAFT_166942 [Paxillus involutus ATCC 200175]